MYIEENNNDLENRIHNLEVTVLVLLGTILQQSDVQDSNLRNVTEAFSNALGSFGEPSRTEMSHRVSET